ncbi:hypothetical protein F511_30048 [Dorcoceras hygrometricum]|uniref:Uncharacterized protein n=1 Tax=Dorcoceras hygrometricum TaxID=472368 RepID=A0A2Z7DGJ1_9LAMI|nr:hypothetical protein F511_30048 [Dorcoceras hygrometricum]
MRNRFSGSDEPFRAPSKKKGMKFEYRLLHDIVAKALCAKAGSFDVVTSEKFDLMVAITAGLKVNWAQVLFQVLLAMVNNPTRQSQGFAVQHQTKRTKKGQHTTDNHEESQPDPILTRDDKESTAGVQGESTSIPIPDISVVAKKGCMVIIQRAGLPVTYGERSVDRVASLEIPPEKSLPKLIRSRSLLPVPSDPNADIRLKAVEQVVVSQDSRVQSVYSRVQSMNLQVQSMDKRVISLDSKVEELLNIQTRMKHDFGIYKHALYEKMGKLATNFTSSQTSLETCLVRHLIEHQLQLASYLDFVKLQMAELVNHFK